MFFLISIFFLPSNCILYISYTVYCVNLKFCSEIHLALAAIIKFISMYLSSFTKVILLISFSALAASTAAFSDKISA
ncbi:MAG: hypothetical protein HRT40_01920 [Campylobacteraceae bacterium]|nr:hypothetical protein [Campylobacteraceae bacterium]